MNMKKVIAFVCALSMMTAVVSQNIGCDYNIGDGHKVFAAVDESGFEYKELEDGTVEITRYSGEDTVLVIPDEIDGKRVTSIGEFAFEGCSGLTEITIPEGVTSIGVRAFYGTPWLKNKQSDNPMVIVNGILIDGTECKGSVVVPEGVTSIGECAFVGCSDLTEITIPKGVTKIGNDAFYTCLNLKEITIPKGVTSIGDRAFGWCNDLIEIEIPEGVISIGYEAFRFCHNLKEITIPESVTSIGEGTFYNVSSGFKICGVEGSYAQKYASDNDINFEILSEPNVTEPVTTTATTVTTTEAITTTKPVATTEPSVSMKNCLSLSSLVEGEPGESVKVDLVLSGFEGKKLNIISLRIINNTELIFNKISKEGLPYQMMDGKIQFMYMFPKPHVISDNEVLLSYYFTIPEDAEPGTIYNLEFADLSTYEFTFCDTSESLENYSCNFVNGSVKVVDRVSEVTTTEATTTTKLVTTEATTTAKPVTTTSELLPETVSGDANNDGIISAADFIKLVQHILNPEMQINSKNSDLNGDGKIDSADAVELKKLFLR